MPLTMCAHACIPNRIRAVHSYAPLAHDASDGDGDTTDEDGSVEVAEICRRAMRVQSRRCI